MSVKSGAQIMYNPNTGDLRVPSGAITPIMVESAKFLQVSIKKITVKEKKNFWHDGRIRLFIYLALNDSYRSTSKIEIVDSGTELRFDAKYAIPHDPNKELMLELIVTDSSYPTNPKILINYKETLREFGPKKPPIIEGADLSVESSIDFLEKKEFDELPRMKVTVRDCDGEPLTYAYADVRMHSRPDMKEVGAWKTSQAGEPKILVGELPMHCDLAIGASGYVGYTGELVKISSHELSLSLYEAVLAGNVIEREPNCLAVPGARVDLYAVYAKNISTGKDGKSVPQSCYKDANDSTEIGTIESDGEYPVVAISEERDFAMIKSEKLPGGEGWVGTRADPKHLVVVTDRLIKKGAAQTDSAGLFSIHLRDFPPPKVWDGQMVSARAVIEKRGYFDGVGSPEPPTAFTGFPRWDYTIEMRRMNDKSMCIREEDVLAELVNFRGYDYSYGDPPYPEEVFDYLQTQLTGNARLKENQKRRQDGAKETNCSKFAQGLLLLAWKGKHTSFKWTGDWQNKMCRVPRSAKEVTEESTKPLGKREEFRTKPNESAHEVAWKPVEGATGYQLDVAADKDFKQPVGDYKPLALGNVTVHEIKPLQPETEYYYRVTPAPAFTATWPDVGGTNIYVLQVAVNKAFRREDLVKGYEDYDISNVKDRSYVVKDNLQPGKKHYYLVNAVPEADAPIEALKEALIAEDCEEFDHGIPPPWTVVQTGGEGSRGHICIIVRADARTGKLLILEAQGTIDWMPPANGKKVGGVGFRMLGTLESDEVKDFDKNGLTLWVEKMLKRENQTGRRYANTWNGFPLIMRYARLCVYDTTSF